jgi:hypothetical protein
MKWPRFRLRSLMLLVVVIALIFGSVALLMRRSRSFHKLAMEHAQEAKGAADAAWGLARMGPQTKESKAVATHYWAVYSHHKNLGEKYGRATVQPWWPVAADPQLPSL